MANAQRGEVEIEVHGTFYTWRLTTNAAVTLETRTGQKLGDLLTAADSLSMVALRDLVWVLLQAHHAAEFETVSSVEPWIDDAGILAVVLKFRELLEVNQPQAGGAAQAMNRKPSGASGGWDWRRCLIEARRLGLTTEAFWNSTPRELFDDLDGLALRKQDERERDFTLAWTMVNIAAATWSKGRVPELRTLLTSTRPQARVQTVEEQRAMLQVLAARTGGVLRTTAAGRHTDGDATGQRQR